MKSQIYYQFILIAILTLINAFFSSAEMAIVSLNKNKLKTLENDGNKNAILLLKLLEEPTKFLSTIQVGITLAGFFSSASAATGISDDLSIFLSKLNVPYSKQISLIGVTIILSYITLVFGELFPKRLALKKSQSIALFSAKPILFISKAMAPFVKLLSVSTNLLLKLFGLGKEGLDEKVSREEIKSLVEAGQATGVINATEKDMINGVFEFDDKLAYEVMTPRTEIHLVNIDDPLNKYFDELVEEKYSRIPVYEGDIDNIIGVLYMRDFFKCLAKNGFENIDIRSILRPAYFVPETKNIAKLFKDLQFSKNHMAILIDEYGGLSGIVSIEDLIEEIMGEIDDEYDDDDPDIKEIDEKTFIIDGMLSIDDFNDYFDLNIESENYNSMGGFLIDKLGYFPKKPREKNIEYEDMVFNIEDIKDKSIKKIKVHFK